MNRKIGTTAALLVVILIAGCQSRPPVSQPYLLECRPVIKTYPSLLRSGPDLGLEVVGSYDELVLDDDKNHFEVILWREDENPYPVKLDTNIVYTFRVMRRPDWDDAFYGGPGATRPAGFLEEILLDGTSIWKDTFYTDMLKKEDS